MTATLALIPQQSGNSLTESVSAWDNVELPGGLPRSRRRISSADFITSVKWICTALQYDYLLAFHKANAARDYEPFFLDLYYNQNVPSTCQVRFVPKSLKLTSQRGNAYEVTASLYIEDVRSDSTWPSGSCDGVGPESYRYFKTHTIAGSTDGDLFDYQISFTVRKGNGVDTGNTVYLGDTVKSDFSDVRFTDNSGNIQYNYWRDQSTLVSDYECVFWVKVPFIPASPGTVNIKIFYSNPFAIEADDIQSTMMVGDDFRSMRLSQQFANGAAPLFSTGICKSSVGDIFFVVWNADTNQHWLYKTIDGGLTSPTLVSSFYAASTSRSHSNIDTNGSGEFYVCTMHTSRNAVYFKKSTDNGVTWSSEVTVASGLTSTADPTPLYVSSSLMFIFVRVIVGSDFIIRCYESTNGGSSWSLKNSVYTVATSGLNALEDIDAILLPSGRILIAWEKEVTDELAASGEFVYSDDSCATYSSVSTSVGLDGSIDHEGGSFALRADGTLDMFYGSNDNGGSSYEYQQVWRITYSESTNSWGPKLLINESHSGVENNAIYTLSGDLIFTCTRQFDFTTPVMSTYILTLTRCVGDDWSDRGWTQIEGLSYRLQGGAWVEGFTRTTATRGFLVNDISLGSDYVIEALVSSPSPLTQVDPRVAFRFTDANNHYLLTLLGDGSNRAIWYKRVAGAYTELGSAAFTPALNTLYRLQITQRGINPTTLSLSVNGTPVLNNLTEATSTQLSGKIGLSAGNAVARRATLARHIFARKYTANAPVHSTWTGRLTNCGPVQVTSWRVPVTVPASSVTSTLTDYPVWVDLSSMPSQFWDTLLFDDGREIRVKNAAGDDLPFDLINIRIIQRKGSIFVKQTLSNSVDSNFYIHIEVDNDIDHVDPSAANGRYAVWTDYHRVYTLGPTYFNRTSGNYPTQLTGLGFGFERVSDSPDLGVHQGVAFDGEYYYVSDTNGLKKYTQNWMLVAENLDPCGDVGGGVNHVGDIHVQDGILYAPIEFFSGPSTFNYQKIAKFNSDDLTFISATDVSAQAHECSSLCINPRDGLLYVTSYTDGSKLWKYNPNTLAYVGTLNLSSTINELQGITFWRDAFWLTEDATDRVVRVELDGTVRNGVWGLGPGSPGNWEGICARPDGLSVLYDITGTGGGIVLRLEHRNIAASAGSRFFTTGVLEDTATRYTSWTLGATVSLDTKTSNRSIASYATSGSSDITKRTSLAYRQTSDRVGYWNNTDGWLLDTISPVVGQTYRYHVKQNGTTDRRLYRNGVNVATDSVVVEMPPVDANALIIGASQTDLSEIMDGKIGFVYLRNGLLTDSWLAAECLNLSTPNSFYDVSPLESFNTITGEFEVINKIDIPLTVNSYTADLDLGVEESNLDSGRSAMRRHRLNNSSVITGQWVTDADGYKYLMDVLRAIETSGNAPFYIDVITQSSILTERLAKMVPGSFRLASHQGLTFTVEASMHINHVFEERQPDYPS